MYKSYADVAAGVSSRENLAQDEMSQGRRRLNT